MVDTNYENEFLSKLYISACKELKKAMFPNYRKKLLENKVEIQVIDDYKIGGIVGTYKLGKTDDDFKYTHYIEIVRSLVELAMYGERGKNKRYHKANLKDTIKHELIHAYVEEIALKIDNNYPEIGIAKDGSFVHASMLAYLKIGKNKIVDDTFELSKYCDIVSEADSFQELESRLIDEYMKYRISFIKARDIKRGDKKYKAIISFDGGETQELRIQYRPLINGNEIFSEFTIGMLMDIENLEDRIIEEMNNALKSDKKKSKIDL